MLTDEYISVQLCLSAPSDWKIPIKFPTYKLFERWNLNFIGLWMIDSIFTFSIPVLKSSEQKCF